MVRYKRYIGAFVDGQVIVNGKNILYITYDNWLCRIFYKA